jgi:hypothetical protein
MILKVGFLGCNKAKKIEELQPDFHLKNLPVFQLYIFQYIHLIS